MENGEIFLFFISLAVWNDSTSLSFLPCQDENAAKVRRASCDSPLSACQCVNVWMRGMIDAVLVLRCMTVEKWQKVTVETAETGVDRRGARAQNRWRDRGRRGGGGGGRKRKERKGRTRDASLQMRGLEARRQFKQALAPSQAWQTAHSLSPRSFSHTPTHSHTYRLANKATAKKIINYQ